MGMITGIVLADFKSQSGSRLINTLALSAISFLLIAVPASYFTQLYNQQHMVLPAAAPDDSVWAVAFSPDGTMLVTVDGQLSLWDLASGKRIRSKSLSNPWQSSVAFSPDGEHVAYSDPGGNHVILWDIGSGQAQTKSHQDVNDLDFRPMEKSWRLEQGTLTAVE